MAVAQAQKSTFEDRLARIQKGAPGTMGEVHIGPRDEALAKEGQSTNTVRLKTKRKKVKVGEGSNLVLVPVALFIGGLSIFAGRAVAYHLFGEGGLMPVTLPVAALEAYIPYTHLVIGALLALIFTWTFGFSNLVRKLAVVAGFAGMFYFEAQVIERFPGTYASFFSEAYVAAALKSV